MQRDNNIIRNLINLTEIDEIAWEHNPDKPDCKYTANYEGMVFRLNCCDMQESRLFIHDVEIIGRSLTNQLCCSVGNQQLRHLRKRHADLLEACEQHLSAVVVEFEKAIAIKSFNDSNE